MHSSGFAVINSQEQIRSLYTVSVVFGGLTLRVNYLQPNPQKEHVKH